METFDEREIGLLLDKLYQAFRNEVAQHEGASNELEFVYYAVESLTPPRVPGRLRDVVEKWAEEARRSSSRG